METAKTLYILRCLADGIDPQTGKTYDITHPFQQPDTIRALFAAVQTLEREPVPFAEQGEVKLSFRSSLPPNAGKPWDGNEDERLCRSLAGESGIDRIAADHGRTNADIRSRLEKLGQREKLDQVTAGFQGDAPQRTPPEPSSSESSQPDALDPPRPRPAASETEVPTGMYVFRKMASR